MKFFTASLFVLLSSAILGGSFASPAHKGLGGLVGGVLGTVGDVVDGAVDTVGDVVDGVANTVGGVVDDVGSVVGKVVENLSDVLHKLPVLADAVRNAVYELGKETGKVLVLTVHDLVDNILNYTTEILGHIITININVENLQIYFGDHLIGTILNNGSIVDLQNNLIGMCDREHGVLVIVGDLVEDLVGDLGVILGNLIHSLDAILGDIFDKVEKALANVREGILHAAEKLPSAAANILKTIDEKLHETERAIVCAVEDFNGNTFSFRDVSGETLVSVNANTLQVTVAGHTIGHINEDGSIVDSDGNVIGGLIAHDGLLILVGEAVVTILDLLHNVVHNVVGDVLNVLG